MGTHLRWGVRVHTDKSWLEMSPAIDFASRLSTFLLILFLFVLVPGLARGEERGSAPATNTDRGFGFPELNPEHAHMRLLLENAFSYVDPAHGIIDPDSGYPAEGWNPPLRTFTQLTAIGKWIELLANIAAGYAENPYYSRDSALSSLSIAVRSLRADQKDPSLSAKGLLVTYQ